MIAVPGLVPRTKWVAFYSPRSHAQLPVAVTHGNAMNYEKPLARGVIFDR
jgi:hypothetical protein